MIQPLTALLLGIAVFALLALVFWPESGLLARWKRSRRRTAQVLLEDTLKHLYDCEYGRLTGSLESVAGALGVTVDQAAELISRLASMGLVVHSGSVPKLTAEGRSYALRIIRVHRLWERYLSDATTVQESRWHEEAEKQEHLLTPEETDALARRLGDPIYDPHGDPIPSASGAIPSPRGKPLTTMEAGDVAGIVHVEDEPGAVYAQLVAQGLRPGVQVRVTDVSGDRMTLEVEGNEMVLAPVVAANVTVVPLAPAEASSGAFRTLSALRPGRQARVRGLSPSCRGPQRRRLMDLGIVPGTVIRAEFSSVAGDPVAYRIRGATIALRREQSDQIYIDPMTS